MLFPSSYATATAAGSQETLLGRLREPATHPRLSAIRIISRAFPWTIEIQAPTRNTALTCQDILDQLHLFLYKFLLKREMHTATPEHQAALWIYFKSNRTPADGLLARLLKDRCPSMRKIDWLGKDTVFLGIDQDDDYVRQRVNIVLPGTYVLKCGRPAEVEVSA